jgi:hypothetical protein
MRILALVLIAVGVIALLVPSVTFFTRERVADAGFFSIDVSKPHTIILNPAVGGILLAAGIVLFLVSPRAV